MRHNRPSRRGFLQCGADLTSASAEAIAAADSAFDAAPLDRSQLLTSVRRRAMACDWEVQLAASQASEWMEHVLAALDLVESLEDQMTVYRDDSEIIRINRQAASAPVSVESRLFEVLQTAERVFHETSGALDITSDPLSAAWGFSRRRGRVPDDAEIARALECVGMQRIKLDADNRTISFDRPGVSINLNSIGKGYALDRMAEMLSLVSVDSYLLHGGKSSVLARGGQPGGLAGNGWPIGLRHPLRPAQRLCEFHLRDEALSTSGAGTQFFHSGGRRYGHILDPRTGRPAEGVFSATVIAPTAVEAEALSTAFYVMGPDKVAEFCNTRPDAAALLVVPDDRAGEVRLLAFNLDESRWRQLAS